MITFYDNIKNKYNYILNNIDTSTINLSNIATGSWATISSTYNFTYDFYNNSAATNEWATSTSDFYYVRDFIRDFIPVSPQERLREILRQRQAPIIIGTRKPIVATSKVKEIRARETLRRILGENKFRLFVRNGFISVRAKSGLVYQIFPGHGITSVYRDGEMVERLCVVLKGSFPPTDSLIMRYLLILNDEKDFRSHAIKHSVLRSARNVIGINEHKPLTEIFRTLKAG